MPALAFSLERLARLGPLFCEGEFFWIPALALAADQSEPKASPPALEVEADGLWDDAGEVMEDTLALALVGWPVVAAETEVK